MKTGWLLWDHNKVGTYHQCKAVESCLADFIIFEEKPINLSWWEQLLPVFWKTSYPDFLIAGGRQAIHIARSLRHQTKTIIVQNPRCHLKHFTVVIAPQHDELSPSPNLITTLGSLTMKRSFEGVIPWDLPQPWCGILIGGNSRHYTYTLEDADRLGSQLQKFSCSFLVTPSRRTPDGWCERLCTHLKNYWLWDGKTPNPYGALLSHADQFVVTSDSISMLSEACSTGKPVYSMKLPLKTPRIQKFSAMLIEKGYAASLEDHYSFSPQLKLNELERIRPLILDFLLKE